LGPIEATLSGRAAVVACNCQIPWLEQTTSGIGSLLKQYLEILFVGHIGPEASRLAVLAFTLACCTFGMLFVILDVCIFFARKRSLFQVEYHLSNILGLFIALPLASGIVGLLGFWLDILQSSRAAAVAVGIAWPAFLLAFFNASEGMAQNGEDTESGGEVLE
jgi:hypothetical protein